MKWAILILTHLLVFMWGIHLGELSEKEGHRTAYELGRWIRSWFV